MKKFLLCMLAVSAAAAFGAAELPRFAPRAISPRKCVLGSKNEITLVDNGKVNFEVVTAAKPSHTVLFAAQELANFLGEITGTPVKVLRKATGKKCAFLVGDCAAAKEAGLDLKKLDRDGFYIKTFKGNIILIGNDDAKGRPAHQALYNERGTLYAVYEFLERFGGVRFYFPGRIGTVVPAKKNWSLPSIDLADRPDNQYRRQYCVEIKALNQDKKDFMPEGMEFRDTNRLTILRGRMSTLNLPNCHGLAYLGLIERFAKTNPEYFALRADGGRLDGTNVTHPNYVRGHVCFSSPIKEVIYQDAAAFLQGKPASSRNIILPDGKCYWNSQLFSYPFFNIMPNDSMFPCQCAPCKAAYAKGLQGVSDLVWGFKTDIAKRLLKNKIPGYITAMAYADYKSIPTMEIPKNMIVQLAISGPWKELNPVEREKDFKLLADWYKKLGQKTYLWVYVNKSGARISDVPNFTPEVVGSFFKRAAKYTFGAFFECETDHWLFGFLNYYIYGKMMWNSNTDVEQLIAEHCELMYGKGASSMRKVYKTLEKCWVKDIMTNIRETPAGPQAVIPSQYDIWNKIFSPERVKYVEDCFNAAEKAAAADKKSLERIKFMRKELWGKVAEGRKAYDKVNSDRSMWKGYMAETAEKITIDGKINEKAWKNAQTLYMIPRDMNNELYKVAGLKKGNEVNTSIKLLKDRENFYVAIESEEPFTDRMVCGKRKKDEAMIWQDNLVELFFSPGRRSDLMYQIMISSNGSITDMRSLMSKHGYNWESQCEYKVSIVPGKKWILEVRIPLSSMPELKDKKEFFANFTRGRVIKGEKVMSYYVWTPFPRHIPENCGTITVGPVPADDSVIKFGDFDGKVLQKRFVGDWGNKNNWFTSKEIWIDNKIFRTAGGALRMESTGTKGMTVCQYITDLKPKTKYKFSYCVRLENLVPLKGKGGFYINIRQGGSGAINQVYSFPGSLMTGSNNWVRFEHEFITTPDVGKTYRPYVGLYISNAKGKVWIDNMKLHEVK